MQTLEETSKNSAACQNCLQKNLWVSNCQIKSGWVIEQHQIISFILEKALLYKQKIYTEFSYSLCNKCISCGKVCFICLNKRATTSFDIEIFFDK